MTSFFGGNPFASPVGQKIELATDASLPSENWALNMEICDIINETEDGPKDAMKAIRKRLSQNAARNFTVVMYTLTVLETCVKNCGRRFHLLACNKEFVQELVKIIGPKNDPPTAVQEKVLSLVQCWADAFRSQPELSGVVQVYMDLKQKGIEFPMTDLDTMAPIHTPQRSLPEEVGQPALPNNPTPPQTESAPGSPTKLSSDQLGKLTSELQVVEGNMAVLGEMLVELVPGKEHPSDLQLLQELHSTCQAMQQRLVELISQLSNEEITADLLRINDALNNLFLRYSRFEKNRKTSSKDAETPTNAKEEESLIDLSDAAAGLAPALGGLSLEPQVSQNTHSPKDDEFDMFAQSRNLTYESSKTGVSSYEANQDPSVLSSSLGASAQSRGQTMHSERDFDEMAAWLEEKPAEESLTSSEFERFLAERAAAAEALPTTDEVTPNATPTRRRARPTEDPMYAL